MSSRAQSKSSFFSSYIDTSFVPGFSSCLDTSKQSYICFKVVAGLMKRQTLGTAEINPRESESVTTIARATAELESTTATPKLSSARQCW